MRSAIRVTDAARRGSLAAALMLSLLDASASTKAQTASAQQGSEESVRDFHALRAHSTSVQLDQGRISVSRQPGKPVRVSVRSDSGTFILIADSGVVARWADSAATLPDPPAVSATPQKVSYKMWQLRAQGDSGALMRFARIPTTHGPDLVLAVFNGAWGTLEYLGPHATEVLTALRGTTSHSPADSGATTNAAPAGVVNTAPSPNNWPDTGDILPLHTADSTWRPVLANPIKIGGPHPIYPPALLRAHIAGEVLFQFYVDTTGHAEMRSLRLVSSTNPQFALACRSALPQWTFVPAVFDGKKVRELVQQPFTFALHKPKPAPSQ
jgi:TonB family protein